MTTEIKTWYGEYEGIDFEINNWNVSKWSYYMKLPIKKFPVEMLKLVVKTAEYKESFHRWWSETPQFFHDVDFHGGCTFYAIEGQHGVPFEYAVIKVGCDFQHYFDEKHFYDYNYVYTEAIKTIESFLAITHTIGYKLNLWCPNCGSWFPEDEGFDPGFGNWTSVCKNCVEKVLEYKASYEERTK